jgi:predicted pyridoxine 5'-phosphate oxidase superfamily flavin-nucleotide-binding protein
MTWRDLERAAPEIAEPGKTRLQKTRVALLATLRRDGSPRISPVEPYLAEGHLLFGAMAWTLKVRDLERDARCTLHSAITGPNEREGELKLYGRAIEADDEVRAACGDGW